MSVQINEVVIRAILVGNNNLQQAASDAESSAESIAAATKEEVAELINEIMQDKKER